MLDWSALLGSTESVAVALVGAWVYSSGLRLEVAVRIRHRRLLLGVEYGDGRAASNVASHSWPPSADSSNDEPTLDPYGSQGSDRCVDVTYFLSPLPPPSPLTVYCAWPEPGLTETRTVHDGTGLTEALQLVQVLWPEEPYTPPQPESPMRPVVPTGGWFDNRL